jgi:transcriptional regulator with XRE-family HTH domain
MTVSPESLPFSDYLRSERKRKGVTQQQLADALQVKRQTVIEWESGRQVPAPTNRRAIEAELAKPAEARALPLASADGDNIEVDRLEFGRMYGRLETTVEMVNNLKEQASALSQTAHAVGASLEAMRSALDRVAGGVERVIEDGLARFPAALNPAIVRAAQAVANMPKEPRPSADAGPASGTAAASGAPAPATQPARRRGRRAS